MVRPSQERATRALTDDQSSFMGDGTDVGDDGIDFESGGTNPDVGSDGDQAGSSVEFIYDSSTWGGLIDYATARWWDITLTDDVTITITGAPAAGIVGRLHVVLRQGSGAPWTVTWPAEVLWRDTDGTEGGAAPTLAVVEEALDVLVFTTFDAGTTWGGEYDSAGSANAELNIEGGQSVIFPHGSMGATETFDPTDGNVHTGTLSANCTFTLNAPTGSGACTLELWLTEDGTGGWTVTWPGSVTEQGTHDTTLGTTSRVIVESIDGGTSWVATWIGEAGEPTADAHIADSSDAHDASAISILDTGAYYTGTDVEAALQEIGADLAAAPTSGGASEHAHVVSETHLSNGSTVTWTLDQAYEPGSVIAWNTTSLARLGVTEVLPDQATVSAAGSSGDSIVFDYAATVGA